MPTISLPGQVKETDTLKYFRESFNQLVSSIGVLSTPLEYKRKGNSFYEDFVSGWDGTPFKVYWNGMLPVETQLPLPVGRIAAPDSARLSFNSYVAEPLLSDATSSAVFSSDDFGSNSWAMGAYISPGWKMDEENLSISVEIRLRTDQPDSTYTIGLFSNRAGYDKPIISPAVTSFAPTHQDFVGFWYSSELAHTGWRYMSREGNFTTVDQYFPGPEGTKGTNWKTFKIVRSGLGFNTVEFFIDGASSGAVQFPLTTTNYMLGILCGNLLAKFEVDYVKVDHDLVVDR